MDAIMERINVNFIIVSLDTGKVRRVNKRQPAVKMPSADTNNNTVALTVTTDQEEEEEETNDDTARRKEQFSAKRAIFSGNIDVAPSPSHPLDCLFESTSQRNCIHLNSEVASNDRIRYQLFSAFEEIEINIFDTIMEAVI
jgi:hypothetical protein